MQAKEIEGIKIIRYESSIFYANVDNFVYKIGKLSGVNQNEVLERINDKIDEYSKSICPNLMVYELFYCVTFKIDLNFAHISSLS